MAIYDFECNPDFNGCGEIFEVVCLMSEISSKKPECPRCAQVDPVFRIWSGGRNVFGVETCLGSLADRNASKLSNDEKLYLYEKHRTKKTGEKLKPINRRLEEQ